MEPSVRKVRLADKTEGLVWSRAKMREQTEYSDVTLISQEGVQFPAHRLILGVTSSFLQSKMSRTSGREILLKTVKTEVLSALLTFIYEGEAVISEADAELFIETAKSWNIRQFLRLKRKKKKGKITKPDNRGVDGGGGVDGGYGGIVITRGWAEGDWTCGSLKWVLGTLRRNWSFQYWELGAKSVSVIHYHQ